MLWAITPARDPATKRSTMLRVSLSLPIKRLIWRSQIEKEKKISECTSRTQSITITIHRMSGVSYLLICHELEGRLRGNFDDVHTVAAPQRPHSTLFDHLHHPSHDAHVVGSGSINLTRKKKSIRYIQRLDMSSSKLDRGPTTTIWRSDLIFGPRGCLTKNEPNCV